MYAVESNPQIAMMFLSEYKILERIYQKLYHADKQVKLITLKVFSAISGAIENEDEQTFLTVEFMVAIESLMGSSQSDVRHHAAFCFSNVVCSNSHDIQKVLDHPLFLTFLTRMRTESNLTILKDLALSAANLVKLAHRDQLIRLARFDLVGAILALADQADKNKNVLQLCFRAIAEMVERGEDLRSEFQGVNPILSELSSLETLYHRLSNEIEGMPGVTNHTKDLIEYIDNLLLTHTNIYN